MALRALMLACMLLGVVIDAANPQGLPGQAPKKPRATDVATGPPYGTTDRTGAGGTGAGSGPGQGTSGESTISLISPPPPPPATNQNPDSTSTATTDPSKSTKGTEEGSTAAPSTSSSTVSPSTSATGLPPTAPTPSSTAASTSQNTGTQNTGSVGSASSGGASGSTGTTGQDGVIDKKNGGGAANSNSGSGGTVAAIVVVILVVLGGGIVAFLLVRRRRQQKQPAPSAVVAAGGGNMARAETGTGAAASNGEMKGRIDRLLKQPGAKQVSNAQGMEVTRVKGDDGSMWLLKRPINSQAKERFAAELRVFQRLQGTPHNNVAQAALLSEEPPAVAIVAFESGTLRDVLSRGALPTSDAKQNLIQVARGMAFLHDNGVAHMDLQPSSLFVTNAGEIQVGEFTSSLCSMQKKSTGALSGMIMSLDGCPNYIAPERLRMGQTVDYYKSDVYSFGAIAWQMVVGEVPHEGKSLEAVGNTSPATLVARLPKNTDPTLSRVIGDTLNQNASSRPTFRQLVERLSESTVQVALGPQSTGYNSLDSMGSTSSSMQSGRIAPINTDNRSTVPPPSPRVGSHDDRATVLPGTDNRTTVRPTSHESDRATVLGNDNRATVRPNSRDDRTTIPPPSPRVGSHDDRSTLLPGQDNRATVRPTSREAGSDRSTVRPGSDMDDSRATQYARNTAFSDRSTVLPGADDQRATVLPSGGTGSMRAAPGLPPRRENQSSSRV